MWLQSFSIIFDKNTFQIINRHNYDGIFIYHATIPKFKVSLLLKTPQDSIEPNKSLMKEEDLIKGCIDENNACQRELYDKYAGKMFAVCLRYASTREDAEDALQEAFIRIFDNISKFRNEGSFEGWMRRITVHTVLRLIQKKTPLQYAEDTSALTKVSTASDAISQLNEKDILGLISQLPAGYKIVFNMYAIEGFSHGEIAENLGISEGTSRSQYSRAKKHLQHFIHKLYHID